MIVKKPLALLKLRGFFIDLRFEKMRPDVVKGESLLTVGGLRYCAGCHIVYYFSWMLVKSRAGIVKEGRRHDRNTLHSFYRFLLPVWFFCRAAFKS